MHARAERTMNEIFAILHEGRLPIFHMHIVILSVLRLHPRYVSYATLFTATKQGCSHENNISQVETPSKIYYCV